MSWISSVLKDNEGNPSSKRAISILAFGLLSIGYLGNLFLDLSIDEFLYDGMLTLVIFGLGFVASEKFTRIVRFDRSPNVYKPNHKPNKNEFNINQPYNIPPTDTENYETPGE